MKRFLFIIACAILSLGLSLGQDALAVDTLKRERKVYENDFYRIVVSGYKPKLDTVEIYVGRKVEIVYLIPTNEERRQRKKPLKKERK